MSFPKGQNDHVESRLVAARGRGGGGRGDTVLAAAGDPRGSERVCVPGPVLTRVCTMLLLRKLRTRCMGPLGFISYNCVAPAKVPKLRL